MYGRTYVRMCVCMCVYVCMYVCVYVCVYVCICVFMYMCVCVCIYIYIYIYIYICMWIFCVRVRACAPVKPERCVRVVDCCLVGYDAVQFTSLPWSWRRQFSPKQPYLSTKLRGLTFHKPEICTVTVVINTWACPLSVFFSRQCRCLPAPTVSFTQPIMECQYLFVIVIYCQQTGQIGCTVGLCAALCSLPATK